MIINRQLSLGALNGDWETWCDNKGAQGAFGPEMVAKCKSQPFGPFTLAPWTDVGALQRGLPKPESLLVATVQGGTVSANPVKPPSAPQTMNAGLFGVPRTIMLAGGAVLLGGLAFAAWKKSKRKGRR